MSERLFDQDRLEREIQRCERHFFVGGRVGADAHHVGWTISEHFSEIVEKPKSRKFLLLLDTDLWAKISEGDQFIML